jgi:hypothetical protein
MPAILSEMKLIALLPVALMVSACAAPPPKVAPAERELPSGPPPHQTDITFIRQTTAQDLLWSAKQRFGEAVVRRALAAPSYIFAKHYPGMMPPPPPHAGPDWKYPDPPVAVLVRENGQWLVATSDGFRQARPDKIAEVESVLAEESFWTGPAWAPPGCTDSGGSLLLAKIPSKAEVVRSANCGITGRSETLVFRALEA